MDRSNAPAASCLPGRRVEVPDLPPGLLPRPRLLARLRDARDARVVTVVAPPGYGKTTLLTQWAKEDERPFAWVSVSRGDNDGTVLLAVSRARDERPDAARRRPRCGTVDVGR